ncbi:MAG TPA: matrixin family metalloprotease, partial [Thermoanaerobaculia bacterium]
NHGLDVFFVRGYAGPTIGRSRVDGPCDKDAKGMDGSVVAIEGSSAATGLVAAHEAAHYLGLSHVNDVTNLMNPSLVFTAFNLTADQGNNMRDHCFVVI